MSIFISYLSDDNMMSLNQFFSALTYIFLGISLMEMEIEIRIKFYFLKFNYLGEEKNNNFSEMF